MLDMNLFRNEPDVIRKDHDKRGLPHDKIDQVIALDQQWINLQHEANQLRATKNTAARGIGAAKKSGDEQAAQRILAEVADLGSQITEMEKKTEQAMAERDRLRMSIPNIPHPDVPVGADESENTQLSVHGEKPQFEFETRTHNELIEMNKWVDLKRAAKIVGPKRCPPH
jgi:seryl-tRNA synthetase